MRLCGNLDAEGAWGAKVSRIDPHVPLARHSNLKIDLLVESALKPIGDVNRPVQGRVVECQDPSERPKRELGDEIAGSAFAIKRDDDSRGEAALICPQKEMEMKRCQRPTRRRLEQKPA